jgi:hypothetical protein
MNRIPLTHANIINILGIESLPIEEKMEILSHATDLVEARVMAQLVEKLTDAQGRHLASLLEKNDESALREFFAKNNIDIRKLYEGK